MSIKVNYEGYDGLLNMETSKVTFNGVIYNTIMDAIEQIEKLKAEQKIIENLFETFSL